MNRCTWGLTLAAVLISVAPVRAQQKDPFAGPEQFPEFRNLSGLAGGHNHFHIAGASASNTSSPAFGSGTSHATLIGTFGTTLGPVNLAITDMVKSFPRFDQAVNLQLQYSPKTEIASRIVGSIGVQDIRGHGGSAGEGFPADDRKSSRSFFAVITARATANGAKHPVYISAGGGTRRFNHGFFSVSGQVAEPARLFVEYDGFGANEGVLFTFNTKDKKPVEFNAGVGLVKSRYFAFFGGIGF